MKLYEIARYFLWDKTVEIPQCLCNTTQTFAFLEDSMAVFKANLSGLWASEFPLLSLTAMLLIAPDCRH
jgi:hypothetical protein